MPNFDCLHLDARPATDIWKKARPPLAFRRGFSYGQPKRLSMSGLKPPDTHHLRAAEGWLELGNAGEAGRELDRISARNRLHPNVLDARWSVCAAGRDWAAALAVAEQLVAQAPGRCSGWIHRSFSLHELRRTAEARNQLLPALERFPTESTVPYNLACYDCQLGRLAEAREWLALAMTRGRREDIIALALKDADLKPLWRELK
jgi:tetratricopeptide (TPR) repeat protein